MHMAPLTIGAIANMVKGYAIAIGVAVAIAFVWMWWAQRQREQAQSLAARARGIYSGWLRVALNHPELAEPVLGGPAEMIRYKLFVASLLSAADEILLLDTDPAWRETLGRQIAPHRAYLASREFQDGPYRDCTPRLREIIDALTRHSAAQPRAAMHSPAPLHAGEPMRHAGPRANIG
jgi:hypothetical protein